MLYARLHLTNSSIPTSHLYVIHRIFQHLQLGTYYLICPTTSESEVTVYW